MPIGKKSQVSQKLVQKTYRKRLKGFGSKISCKLQGSSEHNQNTREMGEWEGEGLGTTRLPPLLISRLVGKQFIYNPVFFCLIRAHEVVAFDIGANFF